MWGAGCRYRPTSSPPGAYTPPAHLQGEPGAGGFTGPSIRARSQRQSPYTALFSWSSLEAKFPCVSPSTTSCVKFQLGNCPFQGPYTQVGSYNPASTPNINCTTLHAFRYQHQHKPLALPRSQRQGAAPWERLSRGSVEVGGGHGPRSHLAPGPTGGHKASGLRRLNLGLA